MRPNLAVALVALLSTAAPANTEQLFVHGLAPLEGQWIGEGSGKPGETKGAPFEFRFELGKKVLVRKSTADYPAASGRPAVHHEDLLVSWADQSGAVKAKYWDNEGHVIDYAVSVSADATTFSFVSAGAPAFKLTYQLTGNDALKIEFAISPQGKADGFKTYLSGTASRK